MSWDRIQWVESLPMGCDVELEVCVADDYAEFEDFVSPPAWFGPTGGGNFTTPAGQDLPSGKTGRYAMVRATLTGTGSATPTLSDIQLTCNAGSDTGSRVIRTRYDEAGNILRITTIDDLGVSEDVRDDDGWSSGDRINTLNQIMRQDVGGDTWTFSYDDNGNMTGKTNGVDTWTYTWNDENRLVRVQGPGSVDVAYGYDHFGRMMSRDDGTDLTTFVWDGFDCIREITGMSMTTYCVPEGRLTSFIRDGERYDIHTDALGSVRMVTDENGDVVLRREFGAWGTELPGGFDSVPGGVAYGFIGAHGCRWESASGLIYVRARYYDPQLQRFISRDPAPVSKNGYLYALDAPVTLIDRDGADPESGTTTIDRPSTQTGPNGTGRLDPSQAPSARPNAESRQSSSSSVKPGNGRKIGAGLAIGAALLKMYADYLYQQEIEKLGKEVGRQYDRNKNWERNGPKGSLEGDDWYFDENGKLRQKSGPVSGGEGGEDLTKVKPPGEDCGPPDDPDCLKDYRKGTDRLNQSHLSFTQRNNALEVLNRDLARCNKVGHPNFQNPDSGYWGG